MKIQYDLLFHKVLHSLIQGIGLNIYISIISARERAKRSRVFATITALSECGFKIQTIVSIFQQCLL